MSSKTDTRLSSRQRLARGLTYSTVGPVDVTRGALGIGAQSAAATVGGLRRAYRHSQLRRELAAAQDTVSRELVAAQETIARELAAAGDVVTGLPQALQDARSRRSRRPWLVAAAVGTVVVGGAVAFSVIRRSARPQPPSTLPPSVQVDPKP
ncbi:MAG: cell wall synthesis protein CwsA [Mycobacterium sp.]